MRRKLLWAAGIVGVLLLVLIGYRFVSIATSGGGSRSAHKGRGGPGGKPAVGVANVTARVLQHEFDETGSVESSQNVAITAKTAGAILEVKARQGDAVHKGEVLVRLDPAPARANLLKKKSDFANAQFTYYQQLAQQGLTEVQASSGVSIAQADLSAAQAGVQKADSVYRATVTQGKTSVAQARARLVGAEAQQRQVESNYRKSLSKYNRMLELQRQGFASNADVQDSYQDMLAQYAAFQLQAANALVAQKETVNAQAQAGKDSTSALADIQTARFTSVSKQASLAEARAGTARTRAYSQQLMAQKALVDAAQADLKAAELALQDTILRSPVDGYVSDRKLDPGALAGVGSAILTVQSGGQVWVVCPLPQELYPRVQKGMVCQVTVDGVHGKVFPGRVFSKDPAVDVASRQFNVRVTIDDPGHRVKPGMFARMQIKLGTDTPRLCVPNGALRDKDENRRTATVYTVAAGKVHPVTVSTGFSDSVYTVVRSGLKAGETVVVETLGPLQDGQEVAPAPADIPTPSSSP